VLCAWSDTFRSMLDNTEWKESSLKELPIHLEEKDQTENFKLLLRYMYTGTTDFVTSDNGIDLLGLADYYGVVPLKEKCGDFLGSGVTEENVAYLLDVVDQYNCSSLEEACGDFLASTFDERIEKNPEMLLGLRMTTWAALVKSDNLKINSEQDVFKAVMRYCNQFKDNKEKRDQALTELLPHVRYALFGNKALSDLVENDETIQHIPILHTLLYQTYRNKVMGKRQTSMRRYYLRFDPTQTSANIKLEDEGMTATGQSGSWSNARSEVPFSNKRNYFEFQIDNISMMIGVVEDTCALDGGYPGQYNNAWSLHYDGNLYHQYSNTNLGTGFGAGDRVGMLLDLEEGILTYYKNGTAISTKGSGLPKNSYKLYPIVSLCAAGAKATLLHAEEPG